MDIIQAIVLGIVQGVTAWIPVSSKTQVIIFGTLLYKLPYSQLLAFALALHVGDIIALLVLFRRELLSMLSARPALSDLKNFSSLDENKKLAYFLAISLACSALVGLPAYLLLRHTLTDLAASTLLAFAGCLLIGMGALMYLSKAATGKGEAGLRAAVLTGLAQGLAVLPGISRSGITESAMLLQNIDQERAVRLSFLMGLPLIMAAVALFNFTDGYGSLDLSLVAVGVAASTVTAYVTMSFMLELARRIKFYWFALLMGVIAIVPFVVGVLFGIGT
ncbi:MAG: undecaprenyl-diphosphate phosphatase [Candidatus Micrarchaeota archaeon]|nr:undecaprenyl-diphosphate phosphatase [Candidatus Micrarchaeota archaeon]